MVIGQFDVEQVERLCTVLIYLLNGCVSRAQEFFTYTTMGNDKVEETGWYLGKTYGQPQVAD